MWTFFISRRYFLGKRKEGMISLISGISVLGVALGVASLIVVLGIMNGFDSEVREKIIDTYAHAIVVKDGGIENYKALTRDLESIPQVQSASPFITGQAILRANGVVTGILLKGIDEKSEASSLKMIKFQAGRKNLDGSTIVLGSELMASEGIFPGDEVEIVLPYSKGDVEKMKLKVIGSFTSGRYDYDANMGVVGLSTAQKIFRTPRDVTGIGLKVADEMDITSFKRRLQSDLGYPFTVKTWMDLDRNLVTALSIEKKMMFIILTLIVMVACFNIASSLIMMVMEKTRDIGILKAIGANSWGIRSIFLTQGAMIGAVGILAGTSAGIYLARNVNEVASFIERLTGVQLFPSDVYYFTEIPVKISSSDVTLVVVVAALLTLIAGIYPARKASRMDPVEAIRYE